mgnify:CR=1 FL=1
MTLEASIKGFLAAIVFGMGVRIGWGLIEWLAKMALQIMGGG